MKTELIEKLEAFIKTADFSGTAAEIRALQNTYDALLIKETEAARQAFMNDGGVSRDFHFQKDEADLKLEELFKSYRELKKANDKKVLLEQLKHQEAKHEIVEKIKALSNIQSQPGKALKTLKDLQAQWGQAGAVSSHVYKDLQNEYSKAIETFYYSLDIYKVLQELDFKKNLELKTEIVQKLQALAALSSIKEIERLIKVYRDEWEDVGPVQNDKWDELKTQWRAGLDEIYSKLKAHYQTVEEQKAKNLSQKQALLEKAQSLLQELPADEDGWKKSTDQLLALQKEWKSTGFSQKGKAEESWTGFREACDRFFEAKNAFYSVIKEARSGLRKQKQDLIDQAEALKASTQWKETSDKMIRLQADWKKIPSAGMHEEPRLFHRFRKACNHFFDSKKKHFEDQDAASANELKGKEELLVNFQSQLLSGEPEKDKSMLQQYRADWIAGGPLPAKDRKRLNDLFYAHMDQLYSKMNMNESELSLLLYANKLERLEREDSTGGLLQKEYDHIRKQAEQIHLDILKYENNLGFFKTAKGDNPLLSEIKNKISSEKERHTQIKAKQKLVREVLNRVVA